MATVARGIDETSNVVQLNGFFGKRFYFYNLFSQSATLPVYLFNLCLYLPISCQSTVFYLTIFQRWIFFKDLSPGQTESQVAASWELGSTCDSVWSGLACTCVDLRWLAFTLVEIKFARKSTHVFHRLATQSKSTQVQWRPLTHY